MDLHFLNGGGQMGALMRAHDWSRSPIGAPAAWPQPLKTATAMMLNSLQPMFIAWGPRLGFIYNDAYAPMLGALHPDALGRPFQDIWADIWDDVGPLAHKALAGEAVWHEDLPLLMHRHGYPERAYFTFTYSPLHDETGTVEGMFCACIETTGRVLAELRLRETANALAQSEARYRSQGERLFALFENAPGFAAVLDGPTHVFTLANGAYRQLIGHRDVLGTPVREALPELAEAGFFELLDRVYDSGEPYVGAGLEARLQRTPGAEVEQRFVDFIYQPIRDDAGAVTGIFVQGADVTDRELFVERQALLLNELNHRVKNNLATVQSLAAQTARRAQDLKGFLGDFQGRLVALSHTHDVLTQNAWQGADLADLLQRELGGFHERVTMDGPPLTLDSSQALAVGLILHELATNAVKYGALSNAAGRVRISWSDGDSFDLDWREHGGPTVAEPRREGFGTQLMTKLAAGEMGGRLSLDFAPEGLHARLSAPRRAPASAQG